MEVNKNASQRLFHIIGFENGQKVDFKITIWELLSNSTDTDTELLYTLQDNEMDKIFDLRIGENHICKGTRGDFKNNDLIIQRIN